MLHCLCVSFRCRFCSEMQGCAAMARTLSKWRPLAATYLCRFAAKARFDNRPNPRVRFPKGRAAALPFGRFKERGFLRGEGNRNPSPLKPFFGYFLSGKKVTRRRHKKKGKEEKCFGRTEPSAPMLCLPGIHRSTQKRTALRAVLFRLSHSLSSLRTAMNASVGTCTVPRLRIFFLPSFCFSSSFFFRVMSPP